MIQEFENFNFTKYIFGVNIWALLLCKVLNKRDDVYFVDNNPKMQGKIIMDGICCIKPEEIKKDGMVVIATEKAKFVEEIRNQLHGLSIKNIIYVDFDELTEVRKSIEMKSLIECLWFSHRKYALDWNNLVTLNEKMQWIKLYDRRPEYIQLADKYRARDFIREKFGEQYLIPLLFMTENYEDIRPENLPDEHMAIKSNCWSGDVSLVRNKEDVNWKDLQAKFKVILESNYSRREGEWWYEGIKPCIVVEKLLEDKDGKIPNDYKLHFINGELQFIYCAIDREGENYRKLYDPNWLQLPFSWNGSATPPEIDKPDIGRPVTYNDMLRMGKEIAKDLPYVRVDYYEVDEKLYFGEITISHGAGYDQFIPQEYDRVYGEKLILPQ